MLGRTQTIRVPAENVSCIIFRSRVDLPCLADQHHDVGVDDVDDDLSVRGEQYLGSKGDHYHPPPRPRVRSGPGPVGKKGCTSSREEEEEEEEEDAQMRPCGEAVESRFHIEGEREICKEERDVLEEMRQIDECGMKKFGALDHSENVIGILRDRWPQKRRKKKRIRSFEKKNVTHGKKRE